MPTYIRLTDYKSSDEKERGFFDPKNRYEAKQEDFEKIPGNPIAYWVSDRIVELFKNELKFKEIGNPRRCIATGNDERYVRKWNELDFNRIRFNTKNKKEAILSYKKWFPYQKGGDFKKWYGNNELVVNWFNDGIEIKTNQKNATLRNLEYFFQKALTWSYITQKPLNVRYCGYGYIFSGAGGSITTLSKNISLYFILSFLNGKISNYIIKLIGGQTLTYESGDINKLPIIFPKQDSIKQQIDQLTGQNIDISKEEWDSRETSWDFRTNELVRILNDEFLMLNENNSTFNTQHLTLEAIYNKYCEYWKNKFYQLHSNEEELNRLFIDIYELQDELTPDVALEDITILKNEAKIIDSELVFQADEIMKQFISYAVGVMFGRYSLDHEGLHIANMGESIEEANLKFNIQNPIFEADDDNVIPILDGDWFIDDITERFYQFVKVVFGEEHYEENIQFIENAIGKSIRKYFVKDFYIDHVKRYKKRPIYWLFSSPKGSFQALIYMHRYKSDTVSVILNDYLRDYITKLEATKDNLEAISISTNASKSEKTKALKEIEKIKKMIIELIDYEKDIMYPLATQKIEIDLDDGVKHNYPLFGKALKKVAGLS